MPVTVGSQDKPVILLFAFFFMWIFVKGYEAPGPLEGIRYGFYIWSLKGLQDSVVGYVILPIPVSLLLHWLWINLAITLVYSRP